MAIKLFCGASSVAASFDDRVVQIVQNSDGRFCVIGRFLNCNGISRPKFAILNNDLSLWLPAIKILSGIQGAAHSDLYSYVALDPADNIWLASLISRSPEGGEYWIGLSVFDKTGAFLGGYVSPTFAPPTIPGSYPATFGVVGSTGLGVYALAWNSSLNGMLCGGAFSVYGSTTLGSPNGCVVKTDGSLAAFTYAYGGGGGGADVKGMCGDGGTGFYVWGDSGTNRFLNHVLSSGAGVAAFDPFSNGLTGYPGPFGLAIQGSNLIVQGGTGLFTTGSGGVQTRGVHRISIANGTPDNTFYTWTHPSSSLSSAYVGGNAMVVLPSNKILIGGTGLNQWDGSTPNSDKLIRLNSDGSPDYTWTTDADGPIYHIFVESSSSIIVCGDFTHIGPNITAAGPPGKCARGRIARLDGSGNVVPNT